MCSASTINFAVMARADAGGRAVLGGRCVPAPGVRFAGSFDGANLARKVCN